MMAIKVPNGDAVVRFKSSTQQTELRGRPSAYVLKKINSRSNMFLVTGLRINRAA